jgi:hypothetical protein
VTVRKADNYRCAALSSAPGKSKQKHLHQWIALAFFGEREADQQVRHLDGDKANNRVANLRYGTALENALDRTTHGTQTRGEAHPRSKLTERDVATIRDALERGVPERACALVFDVNRSAINKIKRGELWSWLNPSQQESAAA